MNSLKKILLSSALIVSSFGLFSSASATILQADFRAALDLPTTGSSSGPRILERLGQTLPNAGFELDETDEISNPSFWGDSLQVDLDETTNIITLVPTGNNTYETIDIVISNMQFSALEEVVGFSIISSGAEVVFDTLITSFTNDSVTISYTGFDPDFIEFNPGASPSHSFQILLAPTSSGAAPLPGTLMLLGLGLMALRFKSK